MQNLYASLIPFSTFVEYRRDHPRMDPEWKKSIIIKEDFKTAFEPR